MSAVGLIGKYKLSDFIQSSLGNDDITRIKIPVFYKQLFADFQVYTSCPTDNNVNILTPLLVCFLD